MKKEVGIISKFGWMDGWMDGWLDMCGRDKDCDQHGMGLHGRYLVIFCVSYDWNWTL